MKRKLKTDSNETIERQIGKRLCRFRQDCGLTQKDVDVRLGARKGSTKKFEEGICFLGPAHLIALSKILSIEVSSLFPKTDATKPTLAPDRDTVAGVKRLLNAYYKIEDPALRRSVIDLLKEVAEDKTFLD
jgi:transcriptional regulator with XRE-family HTH domain